MPYQIYALCARLKTVRKEIDGMNKLLYIGIDSVGAGALAGCVLAAAVMLPPDHGIEGIKDSKKLSTRRRAALYEEITEKGIWGIGIASPDQIDRMNVQQADLAAFGVALGNCLRNAPAGKFPVIVDGNKMIPYYLGEQYAVVDADNIYENVSAASIVAKHTRDEMMVKEYAVRYPIYRFEVHKGYGTKMHLALLKEFGPCDIHRKTFSGVK